MPSSSFITDYSDSILINRSVVEDLNATIKVGNDVIDLNILV